MVSYNGFEIRAGQRLALVFAEDAGETSLILWQVPGIWNELPDPDAVNELDEVGLLIGGQENIFPDEIRLAGDAEQFTDRDTADSLELADIEIGDKIIAVDPFVMDGETNPEYELRFTVTTENERDGDGYFFLNAIEFEPDDMEFYRG